MTGSAARKAPQGGAFSTVVVGIGALGGALLGLFAAVIVSVNFVIFVVGHPDGYEAGPLEVFQYSALGGVIDLVILVAGPALGAWLGWVVARRITR